VASNEDIYCRRCGTLPTPKDPRPVEDFLLRQIVRAIVSFLYFLTPIFTDIRPTLLFPPRSLSRIDDRYWSLLFPIYLLIEIYITSFAEITKKEKAVARERASAHINHSLLRHIRASISDADQISRISLK